MSAPKDMSPEAVRLWLWDDHGCAVTPFAAAAVIALVDAKVLEALTHRHDPMMTDAEIVARVMGREV